MLAAFDGGPLVLYLVILLVVALGAGGLSIWIAVARGWAYLVPAVRVGDPGRGVGRADDGVVQRSSRHPVEPVAGAIDRYRHVVDTFVREVLPIITAQLRLKALG